MAVVEDVIFVTKAEMEQATILTVASSGFSMEELRDQAKAGHFKTNRAHDVWFVCSHQIDEILSRSDI